MSTIAYYSENGGMLNLSTKPGSNGVPIRLSYLNEGGANFVFRILDVDIEVPQRLRQKLLRLRKDVTHVQSAAEQLQALERNFKTLFPLENLVQHEVIRLEHGLGGLLNDSLEGVNRASHRLRDILPTDEPFGMLVTDMTPREGESLLQLKPKWLSQSPNAPASAKRCRTCALRAQRASKQVCTATDEQESCPLDLITDQVQSRQVAARRMTDDPEIVKFLTSDAQPLLKTLRDQQVLLDPFGVLRVNDPETIFNACRAMTLRDCTLFVKQSSVGTEARLGDLDLKLPEKLSKWKEVERSLDANGWYSNTESERFWRKETICSLSRQ